MAGLIARILGWLLAIALGAIGVVALALSVLLSVVLLRDGEAWYFPGDPALAEFGVMVSTISVASTSLFLLVSFWLGWTRRRWLRLPAVSAVSLAVATLVPALACIAQRQFGEWAKLRKVVWQLVERGRSEGSSAQLFDPPIDFQFAGRPEPVRIRGVSVGRWPGVHIDFGNGGNAWFDLRTMWCDHSD